LRVLANTTSPSKNHADRTGPPSGYDIPNNVENVPIRAADGRAGHGG